MMRLPGFRMWLLGRTVNTLGNSVAPIALAFAVLDLTGSVTDLGLVVGLRMAVNVVFLLFGGALADRLPKHLLMVGAAVAAGVTQAAVAALVLTGTATVPLLLILSAVNGMVGALSLPASSSIVPQLVPEPIRQRANAVARLFFNGANLIGAPIGGVVVAAVGPGWGLATDAAAFLLSAIFFALIRLPASAPTAPAALPANERTASATSAAPVAPVAKQERTRILHDLRTGWVEFRSRTWLWVVVAGAGVMNAALSGGMNVLGPALADQTFGRQAWGFILAAQTAGMMIGALIAMRVRVVHLLLLGVICLAFEAVPLLTLGIAPHVGVLLGAAFLVGITLEQFGVAWETSMQEHIPADKLARVYSYDMVGSFVAIPIGQVAVGPIAERVGLAPTLIGCGVLILLAVLGMLASRSVRELRHKVPERDQGTVKESVA